MYVTVWEFQVKADRVAEFEIIYAPDGTWARLFKKGEGFLGTELLHLTDQPQLYVTIDRWASANDYKSFLSSWKEEYEKLDAECEGLTEHERCLGTYS